MFVVGEKTKRNDDRFPSEILSEIIDEFAPSLRIKEIISDRIPDIRRSRRHLAGVKMEHSHRIAGREDDRTVEERFESERSRLLPLPGRPYENYKPLRVKVGRYQTVRVDRNRYSVPTAYAGRWVWAHVSQQKMGANGSA